MEIYLSTFARTSYSNQKEIMKVQNCAISHIQIQTRRKCLLAAYRQTTTSASHNLPTLKLGLALSSDDIMVPSRELLDSLFTPFTRSVDHVPRLQSWGFWPLLSDQHGPVDGWREIDVDGSTACVLASKEKAESKLSAQLNKLSLSSQRRPFFVWVAIVVSH